MFHYELFVPHYYEILIHLSTTTTTTKKEIRIAKINKLAKRVSFVFQMKTKLTGAVLRVLLVLRVEIVESIRHDVFGINRFLRVKQ